MLVWSQRSLRRFRDGDDGLGIAEVMVAISILAVAVLAVAGVAATSIRSVRVSRDRDLATSAASSALEQVRSVGYPAVAMADTNTFTSDPRVVVGQFAHDEVNFEDLIVTADGAIDPYLCAPGMDPADCWFEYEDFSGKHTIALYATWYDDPQLDGDGDGVLVDADDRDGRRATVVVTWVDGGVEREVRQSTVVAETVRGLGTPEYSVTPLSAQGVTAEPADVSQADAVCLRHIIENFGAPDTYEWGYLTATQTSTQSPVPDNDVTNVTATGDSRLELNVQGSSQIFTWYARAWLGSTAWDDADAYVQAWKDDGTTWGGQSPPPTGSTYLTNSDGDARLEAQAPTLTDTKPQFAVCYFPNSSQAASDGSIWDFVGVVGSELGFQLGTPEDTQIGHRVVVSSTQSALFLTRGLAFDDIVPTDSSLDDYDADSVPGYGLLMPANNGGTGETLRFTDADGDISIEFDRVELVLYTSWDDAATIGTANAKANLAFEVTLCVAVSGVCDSTRSATSTLSYQHTAPGWCKWGSSTDCLNDTNSDGVGEPMTFTFASPINVDQAAAETLELRVTCVSPNNGANCHLAYDASSFPATIDLSDAP